MSVRIAASPDDSYDSAILTYDGREWTVEIVEDSLHIHRLAVSPAGVFYASVQSPSGEYDLVKWTGSDWSIARVGQARSVTSIVSDQSGGVYAVSEGSIVQWTGSSWSEVGLENPGVERISLGANGLYYLVDEDRTVTAWDGGTRTVLPPLTCGPATSDPALRVNSLAVSTSGELFVAGFCSNLANETIAQLKDERWTIIGEVINDESYDGADVYELELDPAGNLYAGGRFVSVNGITARGIAMWDGERWSALGAGLRVPWDVSGIVYAMKWHSGKLYVAGDFHRAGDVDTGYIASWDGESWSNVGSGFNQDVRALGVDAHGRLFAAGGFKWSGTTATRGIAMWNHDRWRAHPPGIEGYGIGVLAFDETGAMWVAGDFYALGNFASAGIGRWVPGEDVGNGTVPDDLHQRRAVIESTFPNPFSERVNVVVRVQETGQYAINIYDVLGREVATLHEGLLQADESYRFSYISDVLSTGAYFVTIHGKGGAVSRAVIQVRH